MRFSTILALVFATASAAPALAHYAEYDARDVADELYARGAETLQYPGRRAFYDYELDARDVEALLLARAYLGRNDDDVRYSNNKYGYGSAPPKRSLADDSALSARGEHYAGDGGAWGHRGGASRPGGVKKPVRNTR